ncbi:histidine--tRNA ligase [Mycoplasma phocoenae]|uniref:Histidine--tRNA ligase n=1 Tax=Mycoplasma phocoenae TaxID=754517 RepID=A0A858U1L9_9MOLU|nr:histidine--tRNA ligase [Mycoplasma phocoenae]QJG67014.1 histidine--tRNA ligase [Mycoplasma phocoenae]
MYQKLKGTKDIFGKEADIYTFITSTFFDIAKKYNFKYIETPIIDSTELFIRSAGETSDIANKEMYSFLSKSKKNISLRPEGTAPVIRAFVENNLHREGFNKLFYYGNMYRYERPQKGRYREFRQGGIECFSPASSDVDFEVIELGYRFLNKLQINNFILEINNLGTKDTRENYLTDLKKYFEQHKEKLTEQNLIRLEKNVLRILDDKEQANEEFILNCPKITDFLSDEESNQYKQLLNKLEKNNIPYKINPMLVRGLDYYNNIVFEFVSNSKALGAKSTILAGGRYDGMVQQFGGEDVSSIGFAFGAERLVEIINCENNYIPNNELEILIAYLNDNEKDSVIKLASVLRDHFSVELFYEELNIKKLFKKANKLNPRVLIFKELDSENTEFKIKFLKQNKEITLNAQDIDEFISEIKKEL